MRPGGCKSIAGMLPTDSICASNYGSSGIYMGYFYIQRQAHHRATTSENINEMRYLQDLARE
jgi:hypothetical protein